MAGPPGARQGGLTARPAHGRFALAAADAYIACVTDPRDMNIDQIIADFELLDDWEERYRYIIELGRSLQALPENEKTEAHKVRGCASQVWLVTSNERKGSDAVLHFRGDSDALIVRGLVAIAIALFEGKSAAAVTAIDAEAVFDRLGLRQHLTAQRSNGLHALVARIKRDAAALSAAA